MLSSDSSTEREKALIAAHPKASEDEVGSIGQLHAALPHLRFFGVSADQKHGKASVLLASETSTSDPTTSRVVVAKLPWNKNRPEATMQQRAYEALKRAERDPWVCGAARIPPVHEIHDTAFYMDWIDGLVSPLQPEGPHPNIIG